MLEVQAQLLHSTCRTRLGAGMHALHRVNWNMHKPGCAACLRCLWPMAGSVTECALVLQCLPSFCAFSTLASLMPLMFVSSFLGACAKASRV